MGPMTSDFLRLEGELERGELRPFYLLVGQDDYLRRRAEGMIVEAALEPPERGLNLTVLSATEASAEEVAESVRVLPFMAKRRVVVVREAERFLTERALPEALQRYAEGPNPQGVLILSASGRCWPRRGQKEWLYDLTPSGRGEVLYWIRRFAAEKGMKISPGALALLRELVGDDLMALSNEVEKLALFKGEGGVVDEGDVQEVVADVRVASVFELVDAMEGGDLRRGLAVLEKIWAQGEPSPKILGAIAWRLRERIKREANPKLVEALRRLHEVDLRLKRRGGTGKFLLEELLLNPF